MERRSFLQKSFVVSGGLLLAPKLLAAPTDHSRKTKKLTILHTNDTHSNIDPFPSNHSKYPGMGGVSKRFELIQKIRSEEDNVLLVDAGDIFQGTPYFNKYHGLLEMKLMTEMGYDVATMGNHDFDIGLDGFAKARDYAKFPFVCSNYDFSNTQNKGLTQENLILNKGGLKIGLFGVGVELKGLVPDDRYGNTIYNDPITVANQQAQQLKSQGCDLIVCLSHLGYEYKTDKVSDRVLARSTENIHLIIGGHTHTFLPEPTIEKNMIGEHVMINQVGWAGINLGRIDFIIEDKPFAKAQKLVVQ